MGSSVNVTEFVQQRQILGNAVRKRQKHVESFLEEKGLTSLINKECSVSGHCRSTFNMEFSPDGTKVASTHGDHTVRVTDITTGKCIRTLTGHPRTPWCLVYHPSSSHILASGCLDGQVRIWDLYGQGCEVWQTERSTPIASLTFHPVDHVLVFASGKTIYFWDWSKPEPFAQCTTKLEYERVRWVKFDPLGHNLYTGISNNTTAQRDEAARVSLMSQRADSQSQRPERLGALYNNLMNRFQEYRRDRVVNQVQSQLRQEPVQSTSSWDPVSEAEMYPGVPDGDIVRPTSPGPAQMLSYARQYAAEVTQRAANTVEGANVSRDEEIRVSQTESDSSGPTLSISSVINTTTEPPSERLDNSSARREENVITSDTDDNDSNTVVALDTHNTELRNVLDVENGIINRINVDEGVESEFDGARLYQQSAGCNISLLTSRDNEESAENSASQSGIVIRRGIWSPPPQPLSGEELLGEVIDNSSMDRSQSSRILPSSTNNSNLTAGNLECLNSKSKQESSKSASDNSHRSEMEAAGSVSREESASLQYTETPLLARFLQTPKSSQNQCSVSESRTSSVFPNIRERLQTNIPLSSCDNSQKTGPIRVLTSRGEIPVVTVVSASENSSTVLSTVESQRTSYSNRLQNSSTSVASIRSGLSSAVEADALSSSHVGRTSSNQLARSSEPSDLSVLGNYPIVPTAIASTSSHASLFQNIYHNSRGTFNYNTRGSFGGGQMRTTTLSSSRTQPYLQNRLRYMSLVGPYTYTEGRGTLFNRLPENNLENSTITNQNTPIRERTITRVTPDLNRVPYSDSQSRILHLGPPFPVINTTPPYNNTLEASDTESELTTHLHNRAYFLPISEDQTRTVSSTSVQSASSADSSEALATRQRSVSRDSADNSVQGQMSGTDVPSTNSLSATDDFVQDMHRFSRNTLLEEGRLHMPNSQQNLNEVYITNQDNNNNTIHLTESGGNSTQTRQGPEPFLALRDNLVTMTDQIEQEMNELNRRINALRDSFNQSLQALRQDRERYQTLGQSLTDTSTNLGPAANPVREYDSVRIDNSVEQTAPPVITVTRLDDGQRQAREAVTVSEHSQGLTYQENTLSQPPTLLETSLRSHNRRRQNNLQPEPTGDSSENIEPQHWRMLHRHYLHPHYSSSILDETINRPNNAIQSAINRAIAGAFMGTGEAAVASNIINQTHRIQYWDFTKLDIPDITNANQNIVVGHCKLHNDASCDIARNGRLLATFVPSHRGFPDDSILAVYSLEPGSRGQCLYTKSFGPNAISISISPRNNFVMVGLAAKRLSWVFIRNQMVAQIYKFEKENGGEKSMKHVTDVIHPCDMDIRTHISGNAAKWLPIPGHGLVYGTNRGDLRLCRPFCMVPVDKNSRENKDNVMLSTNQGPVSRRNILQMLGLSNSTLPRTISISTQTNIRGIRQNSGTQTDNSDSD